MMEVSENLIGEEVEYNKEKVAKKLKILTWKCLMND
jgi:hypothetical protein